MAIKGIMVHKVFFHSWLWSKFFSLQAQQKGIRALQRVQTNLITNFQNILCFIYFCMILPDTWSEYPFFSHWIPFPTTGLQCKKSCKLHIGCNVLQLTIQVNFKGQVCLCNKMHYAVKGLHVLFTKTLCSCKIWIIKCHTCGLITAYTVNWKTTFVSPRFVMPCTLGVSSAFPF